MPCPWPSDRHCSFKMLISWKDSENNCLNLRKSDHGKSAGGLEKIRPSWPFFFFYAVEMSLGPHKVIKAERTFTGVDFAADIILSLESAGNHCYAFS